MQKVSPLCFPCLEVLKIESKFLFMYIHIFSAQPRKDSSRCLGIWQPIHTVHSSTRIFQSHAKTKCSNSPTEGFFFCDRGFYLHFMFGEVEVLKILVMHSWRWDESFQISASISTCPFLLNLWGGAVGFFEVLDTLIRVTLSSRCDPLIGYLNFIS